jgi:CBS domain-containing membrane protein
VLGGPHIASLGYGFVIVPIGINSLVLVLAALAYNNATGRSYPRTAPMRRSIPIRRQFS